MNNLDNFYNDRPDSFKEKREKRRKRKNNQKTYSSTDYILDAKGLLIKLVVSFIYFMISTSVTMIILSLYMYFKDMAFMLVTNGLMLLICWGTSIVLKGKKNIIKLLVIVIALSCAVILSPYILVFNIIFISISAITSIFTIVNLRKPEKIIFSATTLVASLSILVALQIVFSFEVFKIESAMQIKSILSIVSIGWLIISIFLLNQININRITKDNYKISKSMIYGNVMMTSLFIGVVFLVASMGKLKEIILEMLRKGILAIFSRQEYVGEVIVEAVEEEVVEVNIADLLERGESSPFWKVMEQFFYVIAFIILAIVIFFIIRKLFKVIKSGLSKLFQYMNNNQETEPMLEFNDVEESTFDKQQFNNELKDRWQNFKKKLTRKPRLSDFKNNKDKIRFIFKKYLINYNKKAQTTELSTTARELLNTHSADTDSFLKGYEKARYSNHEINDTAVKAGLTLLGKLDEKRH